MREADLVDSLDKVESKVESIITIGAIALFGDVEGGGL